MSARRVIPALAALLLGFLAVSPASATLPRVVLAEDFTATW